MQLKSPTVEPLCVSLTNGTGLRIGPDGRDVPKEFFKEAFAAGAIPCDMSADQVGENIAPKTSDEQQEILISGIKKMLVENADDFTGAGLPNRKVLSGIVGWNVSVQELSAAWAIVQAEVEQQ